MLDQLHSNVGRHGTRNILVPVILIYPAAPVYELSSDSEEEIGLDADDDDLEIISSAALTWTRHVSICIQCLYDINTNSLLGPAVHPSRVRIR